MGTISLSSSKAWKGQISWSIQNQDVAGNYSEVYIYAGMWKTDGYLTSSNSYTSGTITINGTSYDLIGYREFKDEVCIFEKTITIYHNSDGSKSFNISLSCKGQASTSLSGVTLSGSGTVTLTTIPRASGLSVSNGTLGTSQLISADRKSDSFTHTLTWESNGETGTIADKSSATSWNFTPPLSLAEYVPNGVSLNMKFTLTTYNSGTAVGSASKTVSMSVPTTVVPNCGITVEDTTTCFAELGKYLQKQSKLKITVTGIGVYGSGISAFEVKADGITYSTTRTSPVTNDSYEVTTDVLQSEGTQTVTATVTDTRGRKSTVEATIEIQSYNAPRITQLTVHRCNSDGSENQSGQYAKVTYSFSVSSASSGTPKLRYKKTTETTWTEISLPGGQSADNVSRIFPADDGSAYDIELVISDSYGTASRKTSLSTGYTIMHFPASGKGVSIGKIAEGDGFDVGMIATFRLGLTTLACPISVIAEDTIQNWAQLNNNVFWFNTAGIITDQPSKYGFLLNFSFGSDVFQIWHTQANGGLYIRSGNSAGWAGTWTQIGTN